MRRQIPRLVLLLATAFLTGCIRDPFVQPTLDETPEDAESDAPDARRSEPTSTPAPEPASPNGKPAPTSESSDSEPAMEEPASPTMTSIDVAFQGRTGARVCRGHPADPSFTCLNLQPGDNTIVPLESVARPVVLQGLLTWNASTPSNGHL
ncbi:MAG TPA: hypothetical protein VGB18_01715, partial [Candidatus Thermoplasmatota archaeon]